MGGGRAMRGLGVGRAGGGRLGGPGGLSDFRIGHKLIITYPALEILIRATSRFYLTNYRICDIMKVSGLF